ncbi:hypothetical protein F511_24671 [Dorcoceras hygrometricum]|uniref:Uncharacterized protein n=1 Tax=Dorcoceras hygrometricum TaxID=472368 RepID=A0A2Z7D6W6_9LAMI|nr:hypothetical protein F511_24671 [Dorcoceras hygrometricum]
MVIGSLETLDLPMVIDLTGIFVLKGSYCTLTMTDWFLQALSVIPRGSWGYVARCFTMIRWVSPKICFRSHKCCEPMASCIPEPLRVTQVLVSQFPYGYDTQSIEYSRRKVGTRITVTKTGGPNESDHQQGGNIIDGEKPTRCILNGNNDEFGPIIEGRELPDASSTERQKRRVPSQPSPPSVQPQHLRGQERPDASSMLSSTRLFSVDCGSLRQSGPRPDPRLLRQAALEALTRSARTDSPRRVGRKQISGDNGRRRRRRTAGGGGGVWRGGEGRLSLGIQLAVGPQPLWLRNHNSGPAQRIMVKRLATSPHDPLGITDSACKNHSVVVSVQYGPFNPYIPIRSTTIGKSRVAIDPIAMRTSWRSNSDISLNAFRVVRTNQYNQDLGLIHSTNGNHLESPNEGSSIDHQGMGSTHDSTCDVATDIESDDSQMSCCELLIPDEYSWYPVHALNDMTSFMLDLIDV